jgi:hypothetical protein
MPTIIRETSVEESVEHFQAAEASVEAGPAEIAPLPAEARPERPPYMSDMPPAARPEPPVEELPAEDLVIPPPAIERIAENADFDFEARVAAAMAAYNQTPAADVSPVDEAPPAVSEEPLPANVAMEAPAEDEVDDHPLASPVAPAEAVTAQSTRPRFEPPPSFEYYPPIRMPEMPRIVDRPIERPVVERPHAERPVVEQPTIERHAPEPIVETVAAPVAEPAPPPVPPEEMTWTAARAGASGAAAPAVLEEPPVAHHDAAVAASLGAALPTAVAAAEQTGADQEAIAQVVSRVMERFAPALVDEIMRELKAKK